MDEVIIKKIEPAFTDARGEISDLLEASVNHIGLITSKKDAVRANHYHKVSTQYSYTIKGSLELSIKDLRKENAPVEKYILSEGYFAQIPPNVIHAYKALEDSVFLDITTLSRLDNGYEEDTVRVDPIN